MRGCCGLRRVLGVQVEKLGPSRMQVQELSLRGGCQEVEERIAGTRCCLGRLLF